MEITWIEATKVVVPMRPDTTNSSEFGPRPFQWEPIFVLQVFTDDGIVGLGEVPRNLDRSVVQQGIDALIGKDPLQTNLQEIDSIVGNRAYNGFEMALYDIVGKALGVPVHRLLGGACRDRVLVSYWTGTRTPEDLVRVGQIAVELGFREMKCKCRWGEPYVEQMTAMAKALPDLKLTNDFNTDLRRPIEAVRLARQVEDLGNITVWEDPVPHWDWAWYRHLRDQISIPIAPHLSQPTDVILALKAEALDYANLAGSLSGFVRAAAIADTAGVPCWHGTGLELGITTMAYVHACAVAKGCTLPSDLLGSYLREDDLIVEPILCEDGNVSVLNKPGLGVELDTDALERYTVE